MKTSEVINVVDRSIKVFKPIPSFVATLYVIVSFDNATQIVDSGADKDYEWYASYAITLNVIYLFFEILRLILIILSNSSKRK